MKLQRIFATGISLLSIWVMSHCGGRALGNNQTDSGITGSGDTTPPTIQSIAPADTETDTYLNPSIVITFNKTMGSPSVTVNTSSTACTGTIQLSKASDNFAANTCVQFSGQPTSTGTAFTATPQSALTANTQYKLLVTTDARDASGNALSASSTTTFTTGTSTDVAGVCDTIEDVRAIGNTLDLNTSNTKTTIGSGTGTTCTLPELTVTMVNRDPTSPSPYSTNRGFYLQRSKSSAGIFVITGSVDPGTMTPAIGVGDKITIASFANLCITHFRKTLQINKYTDNTCATTAAFANGDFSKNGTNTTYLADLGTTVSASRSFSTADESRLYVFTTAANINGGDTFDFTATYGASSTAIKIRKTALAQGQLGVGASTIIGRMIPARNNDDWEFNVFGSAAGGATNYDAVTAGGGENGFGFKSINYTTAPTIVSYNPAANGTLALTATTISVTFDQPMNTPTTAQLQIKSGSDCSGTALTATGVAASNGNKTMTLTINGGQLVNNGTYTTCVSTGVSSSSTPSQNIASAGSVTWTAIIPPIYSMTSFNSGDALSTASITVKCTPTSGDATAALANTPAGSYSGTTNVGTSSFGVLGLGTDGISVLNTGTANAICNGGGTTGYISAIDVPVDTTGKTGITIRYSAGQYTDETREWGLRLQYSTNGGTSFTDITTNGDFDSASAATVVYSTQKYSFGPFLLPAAANNNANLVVRWRYYSTTGASGNRTRVVLDEVLVSDGGTTDSTVPTMGTLSINGTGTQSALSWAGGSDNVTPAANIIYRVYTHSATGFTPPGTGTLLFTTLPGQTSYTHTGLTTGTAYYYKVIAVDSQGNASTASNEVTYTPVDTTPPTVSSTSPTNGATGVAFAPSASVTFSEAMNVANAQAAYSVKKTDCSGTVVSSGSPTSTNPTFTYTLANLEPSTVYAHCVTTTATDSAGNALAASYSATFTTAALTEPTGVSFTPGNTQVTIAFTVGNGNGGVQIVRGAAGAAAPADCNSGTAVYNGSTSPQVETGLTNGQTYAYRVCTRHNAGAFITTGVTGSAMPTNADVTAPANPGSPAYTAGNAQVTLGWSNPADSDFAGIKIVYATGATAPADCSSGTTVCTGTGCNANVTAGATGLTYVHSSLTNSTQYSYRMCAYDGVPNMSVGVTGSATPSAAPTYLLQEAFNYGATTQNLTSATTNWTAHSGAGTTPPQYTQSPLSMTGYCSGGGVGAVTFGTSGEDDNRTYTSQTSGTMYYAALVRLTAIGNTTGDYFLHIGSGTSNFYSRVYAKNDGSGNVKFGVARLNEAAVYAAGTYSLNTTYLIVVKSDAFGTTGQANLFVLTASAGSEPGSPDATSTGNTTSIASYSAVYIRQGTAANMPTGKVGCITVGKSWVEMFQ